MAIVPKAAFVEVKSTTNVIIRMIIIFKGVLFFNVHFLSVKSDGKKKIKAAVLAETI